MGVFFYSVCLVLFWSSLVSYHSWQLIIFKCVSFLIEFSPLDLQPLAICDFDDGDTCDWKSEETDLGHRWKTNQGSLCLEAKLSSPPVKKSKPSSWLKGLSAGSSKKDIDINTRFKSPLIPASVELKCLAFTYSINLGREKSSNDTKTATTLSLLQQQKG